MQNRWNTEKCIFIIRYIFDKLHRYQKRESQACTCGFLNAVLY